MKTTSFRLAPVASAMAMALALTACGGGGGGGGGGFPIGGLPPGTTTPPPAGGGAPVTEPSMMADAYDTFLAYVVALVSTSPETAEAADVAKFDPPPTSETRDPIVTP